MQGDAKRALKAQYKNRTVIGGVFCIRCDAAGGAWLRATTDLQGSQNRFAFSVSTDLCPEACMADAWKRHGAADFSFEVLETLEKKDTQTDREFSDDIAVLSQIWGEKFKGSL